MSTHEAYMLLVIAVGAFVVPLLSERIGWFTAPSEMLYGTIVALLIPWAREPGSFILTLAHFGFLLLLFIAGMEIDFTLLRNRGPAAVLRAVIAAAGIQMLALAICVMLGWSAIYVMLTGAVSVSILLVILQEGQLAQTPFGQTLLITGAIGETLTIVEMTGYDLIQRHGFTLALGVAALKLLALLFVGMVVLRFLAAAVEQYPKGFQRLFALRDTSEVGVRAAFAFMLCFAGIAVLTTCSGWQGNGQCSTSMTDGQQVLAAFMAGAIFGYAFRRQQVMTRKLMIIGQGFFLPIFFVTTGLQLNLLAVLHGAALGLVVSLTVVMLIVRLLAIPFLAFAGIPITSAPAAALLLASPLTLLVAITQVGIALGQLDASAHSAVLCAAIVEAIFFPLGARMLLAGSSAVVPRQRMRSRLSHRLRAGTLIGRRPATFSSEDT